MARRRLPPRGKGGRFRKRRSSPRRRRRTTYRSRRRRRNPTYAPNPPRRRRARRGGFKLFGLSFPPIARVGAGVAGIVVARATPGVIGNVLPAVPMVGPMGLLLRAAAAVVVGDIAGRFMGRSFGQDMAFGGLLAVADDAAQMYLPQFGLGAFLGPDAGMGAFLDPGVGQYMNPGAALPPPGDFALPHATDTTVGRLSVDNRL